MGRLRRMHISDRNTDTTKLAHIKDQAGEVAKLIDTTPQSMKMDMSGVTLTPDQMDRLLMLAKGKKTSVAKKKATKSATRSAA